jgi:putative copper resistance protein D
VTATAVIVQWWSLTAVAALLGAVVLDVVVLPHISPELSAARRRLGRWITASAVMVLLASVASLMIRATTMAGGRPDLALAALPIILARTHFGVIWCARLLAAGAFVLVWQLPFRPAGLVGLALALGIALTTSLTGHAADSGAVTVRVFADWVHVTSSAIWVGGLFGLAAVVLRAAGAWPAPVLAAVATRFSRLAGACLLLVMLTAIYNAWVNIPFVAALWTTAYGRVLIAKIVVVLMVIAIGALNRFTIIPGFADHRHPGLGYRMFRLTRFLARRRRAPAAGMPQHRFAVYVTREALLGVMVFACTALLTESTPPRHEAHLMRSGAAERGPYRLTMEQLHSQGGIPQGWIFRPAEGDVGRGRDVFVKLECFACHAVRGESFPPPSRPGPDLTGMARHHPAGYLAESVINPNAVIVQEPGYTGPDGLSIMPDYRDSLTLAELDDLVAYPKSLD